MTEDETVGWHHRLDGHEFEQALGDSEGQASLACCSLWGLRVRHNAPTEQQQQQGFGLKRVSFAYVKIAMSIIQPSRGQCSVFMKEHRF